MARPLKPVDGAQVERLAAIALTVDEIAAVLGVSDVTLRRRFLPLIKKGRERRNAAIRRAQFQVAMAGNATMLIWLGKQYLGQSDHFDINRCTPQQALAVLTAGS